MLGWWNTIVLLFNGTSLLSNYLSKVSGWALILLLVIIVWQRKRVHFLSIFIGVLLVVLLQGWVASLLLSVVDTVTTTAITPARITDGLKTQYPDFTKRVSKQDPEWWKKYGADQSTALILVDDQEIQDKIKAYLFPHLMEGTGLLLQSAVEWWDLMVAQCDSNKDGRLELKDMERCRFDQMARPKKFDVLVERVNTFLADQQNVENLWRYVLEHQRALEHQESYQYQDEANNNYNQYNHNNNQNQKRNQRKAKSEL